MRTSLLLFVALQLLGCSGGGAGGGGGSGGGGDGGEEVLVPAQLTLSFVPPSGRVAPPEPGLLDAASDFVLDVPVRRIHDPALTAAGRLPELLRAQVDTRSFDLVGAGPYTAALFAHPVRPGEDSSAAARPRGRSFAHAEAEVARWAVDRRALPDDAQELDVWLPAVDPGGAPATVFVDAELAHLPDAAFPFGAAELVFAEATDAGTLGTPSRLGRLDTFGGAGERAGFTLFEAQGDVDWLPVPGERFSEVQVAVEHDPVRTIGRARVFRRERFDAGAGDSGVVPTEWLVAFDANALVHRRNGAAPVAFSRSDPEEVPLRYGLYRADGPDAGARVGARAGAAGGFGVRLPSGAYAWNGPYGLVLPPGESLGDGDEVVVEDAGAAEVVRHRVRSAPGRLMRLTRNALPLAALDGLHFEWHDQDPLLAETAVLSVTFDATLGLWSVVAAFDEAAGRFEPLPTPAVLDVVAEGALALWSEALGGPVAYVAGDADAAWYGLEVVDADDPALGAEAELELYGFLDCLRADLRADEVETGDLYLVDAPDASTPERYVFRGSDETLYHASGGAFGRVGLADGEVPAHGPFRWGLVSGPLLTTPFVPSGSVAGAWRAEVLYLWETGPNPWNRPLRLVDESDRTVEVPLSERFLYTHTAANDRGASADRAGRPFVLALDGVLGLRGFPEEARDLDGDGTPERWVSTVALADGVRLGPPGGEVLVRALVIEELLRPDPAYAGPLTTVFASDLLLPDGAEYRTPALGPEPPPTAPRVLAGELLE